MIWRLIKEAFSPATSPDWAYKADEEPFDDDRRIALTQDGLSHGRDEDLAFVRAALDDNQYARGVDLRRHGTPASAERLRQLGVRSNAIMSEAMTHSSVSRWTDRFWAMEHQTALAAVIEGSVKSSSRAAAEVRIRGLRFVARCSSPDQQTEGFLSSHRGRKRSILGINVSGISGLQAASAVTSPRSSNTFNPSSDRTSSELASEAI